MNTVDKFDEDEAAALCATVARNVVTLLREQEMIIAQRYCDDDIEIKDIRANFDTKSPSLIDSTLAPRNYNPARSQKLANTLLRILARHIAIAPTSNNGGGALSIDRPGSSRGASRQQ